MGNGYFIDRLFYNSTTGEVLAESGHRIPGLASPYKYPGMRKTFDQAVLGVPLAHDYYFGTAAVQGTPIRNLDDLAEHFDPLEDFTGTTTINSELQRYPDAFTPSNCVFQPNKLELTGVLEGGTVAAVITGGAGTINLNGTSTTIAVLGLANTSGVQVNQLVAVLFKGIYYVSALVTDTSVTLTQLLGSPTTAQTNNLIAWLPMYRSTLASNAASGATVLSTTALPAGVTVGMSVMKIGTTNFERNALRKVVSIAGNDVTLDGGLWEAWTAPQAIAFVPSITSGQIWSKQNYSGAEGSNFFAMELECDLPTDSTGGSQSDILAVSGGTMTNWATVAADFPWGAWPAFWVAQSDEPDNGYRGTAEIDATEMFYEGTKGPHRWTGFNHGLVSSVNILAANGTIAGRTMLSWGTDVALRLDGSIVGATRRFGLVWVPGYVLRYIDGRCVKVDRYDWTAQTRAQVAANLAIGSLSVAYSSNFMIPFAAAGMPNQKFGLKRLRIYNPA
jgi:hypothetical protein